MINKVTLLLAFATIAASNLFAQKIVTIPVTTKDNSMVLQTDKDNRSWIVHFFCNSALDSRQASVFAPEEYKSHNYIAWIKR